MTALVVSGLPSDSFLYLGFLPRRQRERRKLLAEVTREWRTLVAFEAPHRLRKSLADIETVLGNRPLAVCRELTKLYEEVWRGTVAEARAHFDAVEPRGEFTLVIGGAPKDRAHWDEERVRAELDELLAQGTPRPAAARRIAAASGWNRSQVYDLGLKSKESGH